MRRPPRTIMLLAACCVVLAVSAAFAADNRCSQCGMIVDTESAFSAKAVAGDTTLYFCDIGDLFAWLRRKNQGADGAFVKDYPGGAWIAAKAAYYVHDGKKFKTPMGWGVAAFRDGARAAEAGQVMDFDAAAKAMK